MRFKVYKNEIAALAKAGDLAEYVILEGELLEGGTVEKEDYVSCSNGCYHKSSFDCAHDCHNKKEEKSAVGDCIYGGFCIHHLCKDFNRETPKEKVKLPEKLDIDTSNIMSVVIVTNKIIGYLASKENK